jgi:serine/threonine protein kinase
MEPQSIEQLLQDGKLAEAQERFGEFLRLCGKELSDLAILQGQLSKVTDDEEKGIKSDAFERNRIALNFRITIDEFRANMLEKYFDIQDKLTYFDNISNRDAVIHLILDHRLRPKNFVREEQLLEGNSSIVYRLVNPVVRRHAIALVLKTPSLQESAKTQIDKLTDLRHRNVIKVIDHDLSAFPYFVITEYIYGINLSKALEINGPRPVGQTVDWLYQLADGLDYLRHKRIFHTNMRPSKIYVDDEWQVMLSPFDLGQFSNGAEQTYNRYRDVWQYGSPELVAIDGIPDEKTFGLREMCVSDQYSLGLLAYKILTGNDLFEGDTIFEIMESRQKFVQDKKYRAEKLAQLPKSDLRGRDQRKLDFMAVVHKLLSENPKDRYPDMHKVLRALHPLTRADQYDVSPLRKSYRRCLSINKEFINDFYRSFTSLRTGNSETAPLFAEKFDQMSLRRQSTMLQMAIDLIVDVEHSGPRLKAILQGGHHQGYEVPDFDKFITTLLKEIKDNDPKWDDELAEEWEVAKKQVLDLLR